MTTLFHWAKKNYIFGGCAQRLSNLKLISLQLSFCLEFRKVKFAVCSFEVVFRLFGRSDNCQTVVNQCSGSRQEIVEKSLDRRQAVISWIPGSLLAVFRQSNCYTDVSLWPSSFTYCAVFETKILFNLDFIGNNF